MRLFLKFEIIKLTTAGSLALCFFFVLMGSVNSQELDVTIFEYGGDGLPTCATSRVSGLKESGGDGFLAVRTGPGTEYTKIDELKNGHVVYTFDQQGKWFGVIYEEMISECHSPEEKRPLPYSEKKGWIHGNWLEDLAG